MRTAVRRPAAFGSTARSDQGFCCFNTTRLRPLPGLAASSAGPSRFSRGGPADAEGIALQFVDGQHGRLLRLARVNADGSRTLVTLQDAGNSNPGNLFRYDAGLRGYIFNLSTKDLGSGLYEFFWLAGNDLTEHKLTFRLV